MGFGERRQLSSLLEEYAQKNMLADNEFIFRAIEIILRARKLRNYVDDIAINDKEHGISDAYFDYPRGIIQINNRYASNENIHYNVHILQVILHEIEHIEQYRICENKSQGLKSQLLTESLLPNLYRKELAEMVSKGLTLEDIISAGVKSEYMGLREDKVRKIYPCMPSERMAEIDSHRKIIEILRKTKNHYYDNCIPKMEESLSKRELMGYFRTPNCIIAPTYSFFFCIDSLSPNPDSLTVVVNELDNLSDRLPFDQRLYYGLGISEEEYENNMSRLIG